MRSSLHRPPSWTRVVAAVGLLSLLGPLGYARAGSDLSHTIIGQMLLYCFGFSALALVVGTFVAKPPSGAIVTRTSASEHGAPPATHERHMLLIGAAVIVAGLAAPVGISVIVQTLNGPVWLSNIITSIGAASVMIGILLIVQAIYSAARR